MQSPSIFQHNSLYIMKEKFQLEMEKANDKQTEKEVKETTTFTVATSIQKSIDLFQVPHFNSINQPVCFCSNIMEFLLLLL